MLALKAAFVWKFIFIGLRSKGRTTVISTADQEIRVGKPVDACARLLRSGFIRHLFRCVCSCAIVGLTGAIVTNLRAETVIPALGVEQRTTQPLLIAEKPWEDFQIAYVNVIRDGDDWHMWYGAYDHSYKDDSDGYLCYAHSTNGVTWEKPVLGLVEYGGNRSNNIVIAGPPIAGVHGHTVFVDSDAPAAERFKLVFTKRAGKGKGEWWVYGGTSPDGIHWTLGDNPLLTRNSDTQTVCFRDGDRYRLYVRMWSDGLYRGRRLVGYSESTRFGDFPDPVAVLSPDAQDPPDLNLYNSAATKLRDGLYVMFPSAYHSVKVGESIDGTVAAQLAMSTDGRTFQRSSRELFLPLGSGFDSKGLYVGPGAVPGERPGTWWIYYAGSTRGHDDKVDSQVQYDGGIGRFLLVEKPKEMPMQQVLLAIDDVSLPFRKNLGLYLSKPTVRPEPVLRPGPFGSGAPDDSAAHFYGTVLHDGSKFRMWYYACHWGKNPEWPPRMMQQVAKSPPWFRGECPLFQGPLCYAESNDGLTWNKPALGQVLFKGSRANNALALPQTVVATPLVIKDEDDPDPARRYKMVYEFFPEQSDPEIDAYGTQPTVALATSPDGLHWTQTGIPFRNQFVEPASFIKHDGNYIIHYQVMDEWAGYFAEGGTRCGRTGVARMTRNWDAWPDALATAFALAEPEDRSKRGMSGAYDQVHLGVGAASFGNVCVGLYGLWHNADFNKAFGQISCDFGLLISSDGIHFREPVKGYRFLRRDDSLATPVPGYNFNTVLCQANGILNIGDETRIYHGRWRNVGGTDTNLLEHSYAEVALATLPRDRWGALGLNPKTTEGEVWSAVVTLPPGGGELALNADDARAMRVELADERFQPLPAYAGQNGGTVAEAGGLDCRVTWPAGTLAALGGQKVRLRIHMQKQDEGTPRLYAVYLRPARQP